MVNLMALGDTKEKLANESQLCLHLKEREMIPMTIVLNRPSASRSSLPSLFFRSWVLNYRLRGS